MNRNLIKINLLIIVLAFFSSCNLTKQIEKNQKLLWVEFRKKIKKNVGRFADYFLKKNQEKFFKKSALRAEIKKNPHIVFFQNID